MTDSKIFLVKESLSKKGFIENLERIKMYSTAMQELTKEEIETIKNILMFHTNRALPPYPKQHIMKYLLKKLEGL